MKTVLLGLICFAFGFMLGHILGWHSAWKRRN